MDDPLPQSTNQETPHIPFNYGHGFARSRKAGQTLQLESAGNILRAAIGCYKLYLGTILGIGIFPLLVSFGAYLIRPDASPMLYASHAALAAFAALLAQLATYQFISEQGKPKGGVFGAYNRGTQLLVAFVWITLLQSTVIVGGFFVFIIPGVLFSLRLIFSQFILFEEGQHGIGALVRSWQYAEGYLPQILWRLSYFALIIFLVSFAITLVTIPFQSYQMMPSRMETPIDPGDLILTIMTHLVISPLSIIYIYFLYHVVRRAKPELPTANDEQNKQKTISTFAIIGCIGIIITMSIALYVFINYGSNFIPTDMANDTIAKSFSRSIAVVFSPFYSIGVNF